MGKKDRWVCSWKSGAGRELEPSAAGKAYRIKNKSDTVIWEQSE
jgi:hypothetical protein